MKVALLVGVSSLVAVMMFTTQAALAHRSGCHTLHTCPSDTDAYVCGDLGYRCDGATSIKDIDQGTIHVPLLVEATFEEIFDRAPSEAESSYWKARFRNDKGSLTKIRRAMRWHKANGSFGPSVANAIEGGSAALVPRVNALFRAAHDGRNPTGSENMYWLSRILDKSTAVALQGAMAWHRLHDIQH